MHGELSYSWSLLMIFLLSTNLLIFSCLGVCSFYFSHFVVFLCPYFLRPQVKKSSDEISCLSFCNCPTQILIHNFLLELQLLQCSLDKMK